MQIERVACTDPAAYGLQLARWDGRSLQEVVVEQAIVGSIHYATVAQILAQASLQPHRSRSWKTATIDARFVAQAAKVLCRDERGEWLYDRGEVVLCVDEKPHLQVLGRRVPTQPMRPGQIARREFEYKREGTGPFLAALNVSDGSMWGCCLEANEQAQFLGALRRLARHYRGAHRLHLILDNGASPIAHEPCAYWASHPCWRVFYTPPHASWLNQAELWLRAFSDTYRKRLAPLSRQHLVDHLEASWLEYNRRYAHPCTWSWSCRDLYAWARKTTVGIGSETYATVH